MTGWTGAAGSRRARTRVACGLALVLALASLPQPGAAKVLQCVPYAREVSGIAIHGDARLWWDRAAGRYARGQEPRVGAVLAFSATPAMPRGHVAVVRAILDERRIVLDHANWSGPGRIDREALAVDVSPAGDWSRVRVWYGPAEALGGRENPAAGFIYPEPPAADGADDDFARHFADLALADGPGEERH